MTDDKIRTPEEDIVQQFDAVSDALVRVIEKCQDAREYSAVARLAIKNNELEMADGILTALIAKLNIILTEYEHVSDEELVDIVMDKMKN